jgi:hypothetical protein
VPDAVPDGPGTSNLQQLGVAGQAAHLALAPATGGPGKTSTSVSLFDQGLVQVLEAAVTGLQPKQPYVLALSARPDGAGALQPLSGFVTNPAGSAIVNAIGPVRQVVEAADAGQRQYLVIVAGSINKPGMPVQIQVRP